MKAILYCASRGCLCFALLCFVFILFVVGLSGHGEARAWGCCAHFLRVTGVQNHAPLFIFWAELRAAL